VAGVGDRKRDESWIIVDEIEHVPREFLDSGQVLLGPHLPNRGGHTMRRFDVRPSEE
jgi:hypothetical protein